MRGGWRGAGGACLYNATATLPSPHNNKLSFDHKDKSNIFKHYIVYNSFFLLKEVQWQPTSFLFTASEVTK